MLLWQVRLYWLQYIACTLEIYHTNTGVLPKLSKHCVKSLWKSKRVLWQNYETYERPTSLNDTIAMVCLFNVNSLDSLVSSKPGLALSEPCWATVCLEWNSIKPALCQTVTTARATLNSTMCNKSSIDQSLDTKREWKTKRIRQNRQKI